MNGEKCVYTVIVNYFTKTTITSHLKSLIIKNTTLDIGNPGPGW